MNLKVGQDELTDADRENPEWGQWRSYRVEPLTVESGLNTLEVNLAGDPLTTCVIHDVHLRINYENV